MIDHVPPNDAAAEQAILGAVMLDNRVLSRIGGGIRDEDFYYESNRRIYQAMQQLKNKMTPIDPVTLGTHLRDSGMLESIGGAMAINKLVDDIATVANVEHYAKIVSNKAVVRKMLYAAKEIVANAYIGTMDFDEYIAQSRTAIVKAAASSIRKEGGPRRIDEDLKDAIRDIMEGKEPPGLVKTGINNIDLTVGGLFAGLLTVLAARPAMGKSCLALNVGINVALSGKKVLVITLEDTRYFLTLRLLSRFADVDLQALTLRSVHPDSYPRLIQGVTKLSGLPFWVDDTSGMSVDQIRTLVHAHKEEHGLDLLIVDHILEIGADAENETARVSKVAAGSRDLVKELNIPGLYLHQLNREVEKRPGKRPVLADLKQAGKVEEVARSGWMLYRPAYYEDDEDDTRRDVQLIVAKSSHGKTGNIRLWGDLSRMHMRGWDRETDGMFPGLDPDSGGFGVDSANQKPWTPVAASHQEDY